MTAFRALIGLLLITLACASSPQYFHAARADDPKFDPAKIRADLEKSRADAERRSRELKARVEKTQAEARAKLKLPPASTTRPVLPSSAPASSSAARTSPTAPTANRSSPSRFQPCPLAYRPVRGRDYAFRVEMTATPERMKWSGDVYLKGIFADSGGAPAELYCIGRLEARRWLEAKQEWHRAAAEDVPFPEQISFNPSGVLNTETTGLFDEYVLPMQMSAILPVEQLIFPDLPMFANDSRDSRNDSTFYIRTESSSPFLAAVPGLTELKGERRHVLRVENEQSTQPRVINQEGFFCETRQMGMNFQQAAAFDVAGGMVGGSTLDYTLQWERDFRMHVTVTPLRGDDLAAAKQAALARMPVDHWPTSVLRTPAPHDEYEIGLVRSTSELRPGDPVSVAVSIDDRNIHGSRDYVATVAAIVDNSRVRARIDGSGELIDVGIGSIHRKKR